MSKNAYQYQGSDEVDSRCGLFSGEVPVPLTSTSFNGVIKGMMTYMAMSLVFENKEELNSGSDEWIRNYILPKSASSLKYAVRASRSTFNYIMSNKLPFLEHLYLSGLMETNDANEGINSFLDKRKPNWKNC